MFERCVGVKPMFQQSSSCVKCVLHFLCFFSFRHTMCRRGSRDGSWKNGFRGMPFFQCQICNALGSYWCKAPIAEQSIPSSRTLTPQGRCHRVCRMRMAKHKMQESGTQWLPCCTGCRFPTWNVMKRSRSQLWRSRIQVRHQVCRGNILGILGWCFSHGGKT